MELTQEQTRIIQFGILCTGTEFPAWQAQVIRKLYEHPQVRAGLLIVVPEESAAGAGSIRPVIKKRPVRQLLWTIYEHSRVKKRAKAYRAQNLSALLQALPRLQAPAGDIAEKQVQAILGYGLDFILHFAGGRLEGKILQAAKFGVWCFHHGDESKFRGMPPAFWEIYRGELVTGSVLQRLTPEPDHPVILKRGFFKTKLPYARNIDEVFFGSTHWPLEICIDMLNGHLDRLEAAPAITAAPVLAAPGNLQMMAFFVKYSRLFLQKAARSIFYTDYWNIGVVPVPIEAFLDPTSLPPVQWFPRLPKNKFIADPFALVSGNKVHIVYEDFLYHEGIGTIGTIEYQEGRFSRELIQIKEPFHLSYPFTFEYKNEIYAIPESYQAGQVRLYKALEFPNKWVLDRVLIDHYSGVDNTLFAHEGYWYMFSTDKQDGVHHNLKIHYAEDLFGPWYAHAKNPVKTDIRSARPAGPLFQHKGAIFRPAMDYSEKVEGRIIINKILTLSRTEFQEEAYTTVNAFPDTIFSDKVHTLCAAGNITIVDGAREQFVLTNVHALKFKLKTLLKKL